MKSILQQSDDLNKGRTTSREIVEKALAKIYDQNGEGKRAFIKVFADKARMDADIQDTLRSKGRPKSAIAGLPVSVKSLFNVAGETTTAGSTILNGNPPAKKDATSVARLRSAGAIIIGHTNMTEFAYSGLGINPHYGTAKNPWDRKTGRIPGGSSSGAAVSVTDGMASFALGSDTGGSIRIPSSFCGLTGFKPTKQRVPASEAYPLVPTLDTAGPLAPTVSCCALIDSILAGEKPKKLKKRALKNLTFAIPQTLVLDDLDEHVTLCFSNVLEKLSAAGAKIVDIEFPELGEIPRINSGGAIYAEAFIAHRNLIDRYSSQYDPRVRQRLLRIKDITAADYIVAMKERDQLIEKANTVTRNFDALIMPTTPTIAPPIKTLEEDEELYINTNILTLRNTFCFNFLDRCALSIPMHQRDEAPTGLMIVGETMGDHSLLSIGQTIEEALN
ncbi:MAG: amidase [Rhodospirillales bacterium]|nr:amidase [Rhodospirillales bacterium]|tara:strand:- start:10238 stop:11575 length:1338 start_codon:yes stop_codon:yes gene_type:complete